MKRERKVYMHKNGLHSIHRPAAGIVNLRRGENKRFRNGNSWFIFPQRVLGSMDGGSSSHQTVLVLCTRSDQAPLQGTEANSLQLSSDILQIFCKPLLVSCLSLLTILRGKRSRVRLPREVKKKK